VISLFICLVMCLCTLATCRCAHSRPGPRKSVELPLYHSCCASTHPSRGRKKKSTNPPVHLLNLRPTHPPPDFFFLDIFFKVHFWAFLGKGSSKTPQKYFYKRSMSKKIQKFRQKFRCQFFLDFFCFIAFSDVFQRWEFKNTTKNVTKKSCRKFLYKKSDKKSKTDFFLIFFYHVFGRFSMRGVQKHDKKYRKNKSDPSPFSYSDPPTHHGGPRFFLVAGPLRPRV
jgi:hypothetical protein